MGKMILLGAGVCLNVLALLFVALSFATDHWLEYRVQRDLLSATVLNTTTNPELYHNRNRGLFRTCFPGNETVFLERAPYNSKVIDGQCLPEEGYELQQNPDTVLYGSDYELRKHLMRAHVGLQISSLASILLGVGICIFACWNMSYTTLRYSGLAGFIGAFFAAAALACFHGYDFLEREKIMQPQFRAVWENSPPLETAAGAEFGYSYITGWLGVGLGLLSTMFLLYAANSLVSETEETEKEKKRRRQHKNAYDYMDDSLSVPMPMYPPPFDYPTIGGPSVLPVMPEMAGSVIYPSDPTLQYPAIEYPISNSGYGY